MAFEETIENVQSFKKSLENFLSKCPLDCSVTYNDFEATITGESVTVVVNLTKPKKAEIERLKKALIRFYPILKVEEEKSPDVDKLQKMIEEGEITLKDALSYKEKQVTELGTIVRLHNKYNELDVLDNKGELLKYKVSMPLTLFVQNLKRTNFIISVKDNEKIRFVKQLKVSNEKSN